jgi:formylglycine-generating enzyme required for sulfatase activity
VVTVDAQGKETSRQRHQAEVFTEDLGDGVALEMVKIPGGSFLMGQTEAEKQELIRQVGEEDYQEWFARELPQHEVALSSFLMGKYPITQAQYERIMGANPSRFKGSNRPVEQVSWFDAVEFCQQLSQHSGRNYRLPSEAEWEYACRAVTNTPFYFGETITTDLANYQGTDWKYQGTVYPGNYGSGPKGEFRESTTDVGTFPPNAFGLYDLHGNVWEWCGDSWHENYADKPQELKNNGILIWSSSDKNSNRVLRGGSWCCLPRYCRSALRNASAPDIRDDDVGFRVVCAAA